MVRFLLFLHKAMTLCLSFELYYEKNAILLKFTKKKYAISNILNFHGE